MTVNHFYNLDRTLLPIIAAWALVQGDPALDPADVRTVDRWLDRLVRWRGPERQMDPTRISSRNNHRYLRDSVTMAWGAFTGDNALFFTGIDRFRIALGQMREDGSLPLETDRGSLRSSTSGTPSRRWSRSPRSPPCRASTSMPCATGTGTTCTT